MIFRTPLDGVDDRLATSLELHQQTQRILQETMAAFAEAIGLLEVCRGCDLIYGYQEKLGYPDDGGKTVADVVDEFLKKHGK